jgi:hypothetical protein
MQGLPLPQRGIQSRTLHVFALHNPRPAKAQNAHSLHYTILRHAAVKCHGNNASIYLHLNGELF